MTAVPVNEKIPVIRGLDIGNEKMDEAMRKGKMLLIDVETSNVCNLNCLYCFRDVYGGHFALSKELCIEERLGLLRQAKELGCETVKITGAGEPLIDERFFDMAEYANGLGMKVMSFTNGMVIDRKMAERLAEAKVSLIVKCNSMKPEIEDKMTGMQGYAEKRNKAIRYLMDAGLNKKKPTMLGMDAVITKVNMDGMLEQLEFCRENNIFPLFRPFMPIGGASKLKEWEISKDETIAIFRKAQEMDRKKFGLEYRMMLPYIGGVWCRQLHYALYVNILGEAYACTGSRKKLGDIRQQSLEEIWNGESARKIRATPYESCPMREAYWRGEKDYDCV
jgi:MoaA/NifB/PqqE/SkfB family radical SAM enzyme